MASVVISGDTSGAITLSAPAVAGTTTLTLPATSGTVLQSGTTVTEAQGGTGTTTGYYGFKNRIINGAMVIDQRNAGASVTNGFAVDRFEFQENSGAAFTIQRSTTAPTGFYNSLVTTVTPTAASATAAQVNRVFQRIEGNNIADFGFGAAGAATVTLSFWVRSSLTGTYCVALVNNAANRSYVAEYTINSANTFEYKTITIAGDTSGTWETGTSSGVQVTFDLGGGSNYNTTAGAWAAGNFTRTTNQANFANTLNATFYLTGVQLEKGSTATSFDYRPYGTELQLAQRYYQQIGKSNNAAYQPYAIGVTTGSTASTFILGLPVTMRASPSFTFTGASNTFIGTGGSVAATSIVSDIMTPSTIMYVGNAASGLTTGQASRHYQNNTAASSLELSAEL